MATKKSTKKPNLSLKGRILAELEKAGTKGIKARALIKKFGLRTPARVYDLRVSDGLNIITTPSRGPDCVYFLKGKLKAKPKPTKEAQKR